MGKLNLKKKFNLKELIGKYPKKGLNGFIRKYMGS